MADDFQVKIGKDGRVFVLLHPSCQIEKKRILELLQEAGIDPVVVTFLLPEEVDACGDLDDVSVIIPIDAAVCNSPELDKAGRHCGQAGKRIIVLFDDGFPYEGLHPIASKYGTQCGWSADQLGSCLSGSKPAEPRSGTGAPVARPRPKQVNC